MDDEKLPDLLRKRLRLVFVGTGAGRRSAAVGAYYAHSSNRFWDTLHDIGLTPRRFEPREFPDLLKLGIGLTDLSKFTAGMDHEIPAHKYDVVTFEKKIRRYAPLSIAFTSKTAASKWLIKSTGRIKYGRQEAGLSDFPEVFVLPSPSGAATRYWNLTPWQDLADWYARTNKLNKP